MIEVMDGGYVDNGYNVIFPCYRILKNYMPSNPLMIRVFATGLLLCVPVLANAVSLQTGIDKQAKLPYWEIHDKGMSLRLIQRLPIQTRGYFQARGFNQLQSEKIAQSCVFQTAFKNVSHQTKHGSKLTYNLRNWVINSKNKKYGLKTREDWKIIWQSEQVSKAARLAFEWSLLPTRQRYQPGDYNWGMTIFNLKPGSRFDLKITWKQHNRLNSFIIENIQCAPDINPQPEEAL